MNLADESEEPVNKTPEFLQEAFSGVILFLQSYGWYLVFALIALYYLKGKLEKVFLRWHSTREQEIDLHRFDDETILSRQRAMDESRRRMQEKLNAQAALHAEQQQKKQEEKRQQKLEDWGRHVEGKGYRSKYRPPEEHTAPTKPSTSSGQAKKKTTYRTDNYNPLMGAGESSYFRPERRGGASGGG